MELPPFPCVPVHLDEATHSSGVIDVFLKERPSPRWVLLGAHAVQTNAQLWTAWIKTTRNELRGTSVARSIDAEFMRYLAGTHHVSEAFARSGYQEGSEDAWILYLPQAESSRNSLGHLHPFLPEHVAIPEGLSDLMNQLKWNSRESLMIPSIEGSKMLGADVDSVGIDGLEERLIAHISMADDQSASHR